LVRARNCRTFFCRCGGLVGSLCRQWCVSIINCLLGLSIVCIVLIRSFAYDSNVQGGRSAGTDAAVTIVAIGLSTGQYVSTTATITRTTGQNISLVSSLERNYSNA
jgi:hypothetical protein